jgi:DNA invertase Pin-like site-specific DNA recombinase
MSDQNQPVEIVAYGRNSDPSQLTSQEIQNDEFEIFTTAIAPLMFNGRQGRIVESYADHGKSGSKKKQLHKREDFHRLLDDMEAGQVQRTGERFPEYIAVLNTSRFARLHPVDTSDFYRRMRNAGCKLLVIEDRRIIDPDESKDYFMAMFQADQDHEYSKKLASNVLRGAIKKCREGKNTTSSVAYGMARLIVDELGEERVIPRTTKYRKSKDADSYLIPGDETEQEVARFMAQTFVENELSYQELCRRLNNHPNPAYRLGPHGNGWTQQTVQALLGNPHLYGYEFKGRKRASEFVCIDNGSVTAIKSAGGAIEPIMVDVTKPNIGHPRQGCVIDRDTGEAVTKRMEKRKAKKQRVGNSCYPLTNVLFCSCGKPLYPHKQGNNVRYWCKASVSKQTDCHGWGVKEREILPAIIQLMDGEIWKTRNVEPPKPIPTKDNTARLKKLTATVESLKQTITTADPEAVPSLSVALDNALKKRRELEQTTPPDTGAEKVSGTVY